MAKWTLNLFPRESTKLLNMWLHEIQSTAIIAFCSSMTAGIKRLENVILETITGEDAPFILDYFVFLEVDNVRYFLVRCTKYMKVSVCDTLTV